MTGTRRRLPRGQGDQLRAEVLDGVNRLLQRDGGAEKLTIRAVAAEVGVAPPTIYLHFSDKAELVWAALSDKYAQLARLMTDADAGADGDAISRLRAQVHAYLHFAAGNPGHYRLMFEVRQPAVDPARVAAHPSSMITGSLRAAVARCADAGATLRLPRRQLAHTLWSGLHGLVSLNHSLAIEDVDAVLVGCADGLLDALVAPASGEPEPRPTRVEELIAGIVGPGVLPGREGPTVASE